jgi:hypothetical protein
MRVVSTVLCACFLVCSLCIPALGQGQVCPLQSGSQLCAPLQSQQCQTTVTGLQCRPRTVIYDPAFPGGVRALECTCYDQNVCGPVTVTGNIVSCSGFCPVPPRTISAGLGGRVKGHPDRYPATMRVRFTAVPHGYDTVRSNTSGTA